MRKDELLEAALFAVMRGAIPEKLKFHHQDHMTMFQGISIENTHELQFNANDFLYGDEVDESLATEMAIASLMPFLVTSHFYEKATFRDLEALLMVKQLKNATIYGDKISQLYSVQSTAIQWALAYACLDKKSCTGELLFQRVILSALPNVTMYVRDCSNESVQQIEWVVHVPSYSLDQVDDFIQVTALLLLPFHHLVTTVAKEPPALLHKSPQMRIGGSRIVDATCDRMKQWI
ncbi:hypothetical protein SAMN05880501_105174 [Ureibacillus xyleni]|uniref:Uncharacterized protein n=1 Tax=Ureibacillus xyleni TaxID=614648 RepID=A0A285SMU0_9BACL|nr:hypothetical protein [Ureibacillus xyleni]SOC09066.1 hypothetical protein SAMN05880501_105174 [Ureibacillus xyleni]